jgi:hypothetical protein
MINHFKKEICSCIDVFSITNESHNIFTSYKSNGFVRDTAIPSEDFEIVYCATRVQAQIFLTDDKYLVRCSKSLGLNNILSPTVFCESKIRLIYIK